MTRDQIRRRRAGQRQGSIWIPCLETFVVECQYCRIWIPETLWTMDHVIPASQNGRRRPLENIVIACDHCNKAKAGNLLCPTCSSFRQDTTYDRINWCRTKLCVVCYHVISSVNRTRPGTAPKKVIRCSPRRPSRLRLAMGMELV